MLAGPVAHFELVRIARRRRTFVLRFVFGLILLGGIGAQYADFARLDILGTLSFREMAEFGQTVFLWLTLGQAILVLGLTPALMADAIASERQSKTLHYLLASRLSGPEIVLGKLTARLLTLAALVVLVLPVASMFTLVGVCPDPRRAARNRQGRVILPAMTHRESDPAQGHGDLDPVVKPSYNP